MKGENSIPLDKKGTYNSSVSISVFFVLVLSSKRLQCALQWPGSHLTLLRKLQQEKQRFYAYIRFASLGERKLLPVKEQTSEYCVSDQTCFLPEREETCCYRWDGDRQILVDWYMAEFYCNPKSAFAVYWRALSSLKLTSYFDFKSLHWWIWIFLHDLSCQVVTLGPRFK